MEQSDEAADSVLEILEGLERPPDHLADFARDSTEVCLSALEELLRIVRLIVAQPGRSEVTLPCILLLAECLQEGVLALHTARHGLADQVYAHCRGIREDVNLLKLFSIDESALNVWVEGGPEARRILAPHKVRQRIGDGGRDTPYSFFSDYGTHTNFDGILLRGKFHESADGQGAYVSLHVGGSARREIMLPAFVTLAFELHLVLQTAGLWCGRLLVDPPLDPAEEARGQSLKNLVVVHFLPWLSEQDIPEEQFAELLDFARG